MGVTLRMIALDGGILSKHRILASAMPKVEDCDALLAFTDSIVNDERRNRHFSHIVSIGATRVSLREKM